MIFLLPATAFHDDSSNRLFSCLFSSSSEISYVYYCNLTDNDVCMTSGCITAASRMLNAIDTSTEPCNDFYQFACGGFIKNTFIPDDKLIVDTFTELADHIDIQLRTIIEDEIDANESNVFKLVKQLHRSCMNRTEVEALGLEPFNAILRKIGGWPAVEGDNWNETAFDWIESIRQMRGIGLTTNYLVATTVGAHLKNSSTRSLRVSFFPEKPEFF